MADHLAAIKQTQNDTPNVYVMHEPNVVRTYAATLRKLYVDFD